MGSSFLTQTRIWFLLLSLKRPLNLSLSFCAQTQSKDLRDCTSLVMDECSGKRAGDGLVVSRKGSTLDLNDSANDKDQNAQFCNRIGCTSGRLNSAKCTQISYSEKAQSSRQSLRSLSNGKEIIGSSSRTFSATSNLGKSFAGPRKRRTSQPERDPCEAVSFQDDPELPKFVTPPRKIQQGLGSESDDAGPSESTSMEVGSSSTPSTRSHRNLYQKLGIGKPDVSVRSPVLLISKTSSQGTRASPHRYGMRNVRCSSVLHAFPTGSSTSDSNLIRRKETTNKRITGGESSFSARGKKISESSLEGRHSSSSYGISISDSRRTRNAPSNQDDGPASVRTRRSVGYTWTKVANQESGNNLSPNEPHVIPQMSQPILSIDLNSPTSSHQLSTESSQNLSRSYGLPGSSHESFWGIRSSNPAEVVNIQSSVENFQHFNMDGIAEMLQALERVEQDEELTYEHRDMRLDIDNMSYEELLALEERMGTVSTALTEEALSECLEISIYQSASPVDATLDFCGENAHAKCSICQEEYAAGDEVGRLKCEHRYHVACIHQWLRLKNWCPVCKLSAVPSSSPASPPAVNQ
ncbi:probable E3 ubiquitin-protein ligase HIP1 isoform X3 [Manihot esculenta]|uniref:Uncharacterized protein n=2 Tax=Manihot esculenta TaxID=3983 RepID=A0ACB7GCM1_MANES|nr:probable E3 ubiquitin-protein ligase HIP1 isoform X3 [Manihot esculenta]KAG8636461.1 hypothetical protein MANES_16G135700v8 [Manihot esculenta]